MADLLRISVFGALPTGEEWSVNPCFSIGGDFGAAVTPVQAQTIANACALVQPVANLAAVNVVAVTLVGVRVEARTKAGVLETQAEALKGTPDPGTSATGHPFQTAWVASLRTAKPGASGRGRLYWPATGVAMNAGTLRPTGTVVSNFIGGMKTYLSGLQTAIDVTLDGVALTVWSRKLQQLNTVTALQAGDVVDTQRRRRDFLTESFTTVSFP